MNISVFLVVLDERKLKQAETSHGAMRDVSSRDNASYEMRQDMDGGYSCRLSIE